MAAHPDTIKVIQIVHDTVHIVVRDTIVRVAALDHPQAPTWVLATLTATAAVIAGVLAQWFRVLLDDNRERERVRQVLMGEVETLGLYLEWLEFGVRAGKLPSPDFCRQMDNSMRGFDELHTKLPLLPRGLGDETSTWFLNVKRSRLQAERIATEVATERDAIERDEGRLRRYDRRIDDLMQDVAKEIKQRDAVFKGLYEALPKNWVHRLGAGIWQKYGSLEEARAEQQRQIFLIRETTNLDAP